LFYTCVLRINTGRTKHDYHILENLHDIIEKCKRQDRHGQRVLYERYYAFALKTVFRYTGNYEMAVDVANDTFIKVFNHIEEFNAEKAIHLEALLLGWLKKILIRTAIDQLRMEKKHKGNVSLTEADADRILAPENADHRVLYRELLLHLGSLSEGYRIVFNMNAIDGYGFNEIAEILNLPAGTVRSHFFRAKKILQQLITQKPIQKTYVQP